MDARRPVLALVVLLVIGLTVPAFAAQPIEPPGRPTTTTTTTPATTTTTTMTPSGPVTLAEHCEYDIGAPPGYTIGCEMTIEVPEPGGTLYLSGSAVAGGVSYEVELDDYVYVCSFHSWAGDVGDKPDPPFDEENPDPLILGSDRTVTLGADELGTCAVTIGYPVDAGPRTVEFRVAAGDGIGPGALSAFLIFIGD